MLDISWSEFLVVGAVALVVIGPKELPQVMRGLGRAVRRLQYMRFAMTQQFEEFMRENELNEIRNLPKTSQVFDEAEADEEYFPKPVITDDAPQKPE